MSRNAPRSPLKIALLATGHESLFPAFKNLLGKSGDRLVNCTRSFRENLGVAIVCLRQMALDVEHIVDGGVD